MIKSNNHNLFTPAMILSLLVLFCSCGTISSPPADTTVKQEIYNNSIDLKSWDVNNFISAYATLNLEKANEFATTDAQKQSLIGLNYVLQNQYDSAAHTFIEILKQPDSLDAYWKDFTKSYYSEINYDWEKTESLKSNRTDSSYNFYVCKPQFQIEFIEDSVVIPLKFDFRLPQITITINGEKFTFLLDTGCERTIFGKKIMEVLAGSIIDSTKISVKGIDGSSPVYNCFVPEFNLKQIKICNLPALTLHKDHAIKAKWLLFFTALECDGIIGWDLLHHFDFTIDYKNAQLVLRKPVKREVKNRNLLWYQIPIVLLYSETHHPLLSFFDTGTNSTCFDTDLICGILEIDKNQLKKTKISARGINDLVKFYAYDLPNFNASTIFDNTISYISTNKAILQDFGRYRSKTPIYISGTIGSDWFKDKIVRVDMTNGIFEISE